MLNTYKIQSPQELETLRNSIIEKRDTTRPCIAICSGTGCLAYGCLDLISAFREEIKLRKLEDKVDIRATGCPGFCERGALLTIYPQGIFYQQVKIDDVPEIISKTVLKGEIVDRLIYQDPNTGEKFINENEVPFYKKQQRLLLTNNSKIDPTSIDDYLAIGGYAALGKVLSQMSPQHVIEEIKQSRLRGRGGGGFPTATKWESCRQAEGDIRYVICGISGT